MRLRDVFAALLVTSVCTVSAQSQIGRAHV